MSRNLAAIVYDDLMNDVCLANFLDTEHLTVHGTDTSCDMPINVHSARPVRREAQGWPGDFDRAVVTFGRFSRSPFSPDNAKWFESWTFVISIFVRETVRDEQGDPISTGDLWALDIYDIILRVLAWTNSQQACGSEVFVAQREHEGDIIELSYNEQLGAWQISTRFRWTVISRGTRAGVPECCS